jgi:transcriptional regulator
MGDGGGSGLVRGTVDLMALTCLEHGPAHGLAIARWIREGSDDVVSFEDAALYQSLHRLERKGMVTSQWGRSESNRRARIYELTARGRRRLADEAQEFHDLTSAILRLLGAGGGRG